MKCKIYKSSNEEIAIFNHPMNEEVLSYIKTKQFYVIMCREADDRILIRARSEIASLTDANCICNALGYKLITKDVTYPLITTALTIGEQIDILDTTYKIILKDDTLALEPIWGNLNFIGSLSARKDKNDKVNILCFYNLYTDLTDMASLIKDKNIDIIIYKSDIPGVATVISNYTPFNYVSKNVNIGETIDVVGNKICINKLYDRLKLSIKKN